MYVPIDLLDEAFLTVFTPVVFDRKVKPHVILHVATLVLLSIAYSTDKNRLWAASANVSDIDLLVKGIYVNVSLILQVVKEL